MVAAAVRENSAQRVGVESAGCGGFSQVKKMFRKLDQVVVSQVQEIFEIRVATAVFDLQKLKIEIWHDLQSMKMEQTRVWGVSRSITAVHPFQQNYSKKKTRNRNS